MEFTCKEPKRLDIAMSEALELPRNQVEKLIKNIGVRVNEKEVKKSSFKLLGGEIISYDFVEAIPQKSVYEVDFDIDVLILINHAFLKCTTQHQWRQMFALIIAVGDQIPKRVLGLKLSSWKKFRQIVQCNFDSDDAFEIAELIEKRHRIGDN